MAQAMFSSMISSADLTSRASSIVCWPSRTVILQASSAASIGGSTMSTPIGMSATPSAARMSAISLAAPANRPGLRRHRAPQPDHPAADVLRRQPRAVEAVVLGRRAEVPEVRLAAAGQEREARHLVARPLPDVGARDVADVVEVSLAEEAGLARLDDTLKRNDVPTFPARRSSARRERRGVRENPRDSCGNNRSTSLAWLVVSGSMLVYGRAVGATSSGASACDGGSFLDAGPFDCRAPLNTQSSRERRYAAQRLPGGGVTLQRQ